MLKTVLIILTLSSTFSPLSERERCTKQAQNKNKNTSKLTLNGHKYKFLVTPWVKIK